MEDAQGRSIASWRTLTLDLPPSCIEFCPAHPDYFVVGTYNLQREDTGGAADPDASDDGVEQHQSPKKPQNRNGSLIVFRLTRDSDIRHVQTVSYPSALLDLHFHPGEGRQEVLSAVSSTGTLSFFQLSPSGAASNPLKELVTHRPLGEDDSVLLLSCAWHPTLPDLLAVTTSDYRVCILRVDDSWGVKEAYPGPVITHTLEAWTVAFSPFVATHPPDESTGEPGDTRAFTVFSGGDDSKLIGTECQYHTPPTEIEDDMSGALNPGFSIRGHEAGVTAILPLSLKLSDGSGVVVTGSYDDRLRVYSVHHPLSQPARMLVDLNLGGGVWRLKLIRLDEAQAAPQETAPWSALILASCMHAGARVLQVTGDYRGDCQVHVLARFEEHKSMNYGSDFRPPSQEQNDSLLCVSTSFYDRMLCVWTF
ncbi:hypothetical protein GGR56DRAFT_644158 [Xylariaceae sp. FL0804]|nr:hypothetical protein GGR56DRAFT_644158 [Xylariaceae sp. FL0804]